MILDTITFSNHNYHLVSYKTAHYKNKLCLVKVKEGGPVERFRIDQPYVEFLKVIYVSMGKKKINETTQIVDEMKKELTNIVLEDAASIERDAKLFLAGETNGNNKRNIDFN